MIKKILASALALATVYGASPALARIPGPMPRPSGDKILVVNVTIAKVNTDTTTQANTGLNSVSFNCGLTAIGTGVAVADTLVQTTVGYNDTKITDPCPCGRPVMPAGGCLCGPMMPPMQQSSDTTVVANVTLARVNTNTTTQANTGLNSVSYNAGAAGILTGNAQAVSTVATVVGSNVTRIN